MGGFYEFFAGGGMVRAGLGAGWDCLLANDLDPKKAESYRRNWGDDEMRCADVAALSAEDLPGRADLAWASFPCQDLSLAGAGSGLGGARSGAFWPFWDLMTALAAAGRAPEIVALENVCGLITSRQGADLRALIAALAAGGRRVGALVADAAWFVPQSRPRLFLFSLAPEAAARLQALGRVAAAAEPALAPPALRRVVEDLPPEVAAAWFWPRPPSPDTRQRDLIDILEPEGPDLLWDAPEETARLLTQLSPRHQAEIAALRKTGRRRVGAAFRRTRPSPAGGSAPRIEPRFDGLAGCLRTPAGGSSRQILLEIKGAATCSRLFTPRETARLMGLGEDYRLPSRVTEAYHLTGDGVAPPVVRWLAETLFEPILAERGAPPLAAE